MGKNFFLPFFDDTLCLRRLINNRYHKIKIKSLCDEPKLPLHLLSLVTSKKIRKETHNSHKHRGSKREKKKKKKKEETPKRTAEVNCTRYLSLQPIVYVTMKVTPPSR